MGDNGLPGEFAGWFIEDWFDAADTANKETTEHDGERDGEDQGPPNELQAETTEVQPTLSKVETLRLPLID